MRADRCAWRLSLARPPDPPASRPEGLYPCRVGVPGGGGGIRTHETVSRPHAFQACAFSHSATPPGAHAQRRRTIATARPGARRPARFTGRHVRDAPDRLRRRATSSRKYEPVSRNFTGPGQIAGSLYRGAIATWGRLRRDPGWRCRPRHLFNPNCANLRQFDRGRKACPDRTGPIFGGCGPGCWSNSVPGAIVAPTIQRGILRALEV